MPRRAPWRRRSAPDLGDVAIADDSVYRAAERAAREHYSRVLASLAAQFRDVTAAEDALSESLVAALAQWPRSGVPERPGAWLLTVARRRLTDDLRRKATHIAALEEVSHFVEHSREDTPMEDKRLQLLFACAHPAIEESARAPLMLQVVFGLEASAIAALFLLSPTAMAQRLVRAKQKIRDAGIPFRTPEPEDYPGRLAFVLTAIYALFTRDGAVWHNGNADRDSLADEAIWLGHLVVGLSQRDPEALGLMSLMLFVESRRTARRDPQGGFVPLSEQATDSWDASLIGRAENILQEAARKEAPGRFQLEAAIQSAHAARARTGATDWPAILALYDGLMALAPSPVAAINRALAVLNVNGPRAALEALDLCAGDKRLADYQPYWAARAHVLAHCGQPDAARSCYECAIALEADPAARTFLESQSARLASRPN